MVQSMSIEGTNRPARRGVRERLAGRMRHSAVLVVSVVLALACGLGASVPIRAHLEQVCAVSGAFPIPPGLDLVPLDLPASEARPGAILELRLDELRVDGGTVRSDLDQRLSSAKARSTGGPTALLVEAEVPAALVLEVLDALQAAGMSEVSLVGWSNQVVELPPFPDPELGAELTGALAALSPEERVMHVVEAMTTEVRLCPGAQEVFGAVATGTPDARCAMIAVGLDEALPMCPLTDADRVMTLVQATVQPPDPRRPVGVPVALDPAAPPLAVPATMPWRELLPRWARTEPRPGWLAVE